MSTDAVSKARWQPQFPSTPTPLSAIACPRQLLLLRSGESTEVVGRQGGLMEQENVSKTMQTEKMHLLSPDLGASDFRLTKKQNHMAAVLFFCMALVTFLCLFLQPVKPPIALVSCRVPDVLNLVTVNPCFKKKRKEKLQTLHALQQSDWHLLQQRCVRQNIFYH